MGFVLLNPSYEFCAGTFARSRRSPRPARPPARRAPSPASGGGLGWGLAEHAAFRRQAHQHLADRLEMDRPTLALLGPGMDIAHPPFERVAFEDRARPGGMVQRRDDI